MNDSVRQARPAHDNLPKLIGNNTLETIPVLRACIGARAALAGLRQASVPIPNPAMLMNTLPLLEARASSEIEKIVTTADELFRQQAGDPERMDPATREALRYQAALLEGYRALGSRPITTRTAETICSRIRGTDMTVRRVAGTRLENSSRRQTIYTPPEGEARLRELLADWESFLHVEQQYDPLIRMAAAHYQFEAIHPFSDGNGRTGRVINSLFLVEQGLLALPILYLSRYIIANRSQYYRLLLGVTRDGAWEQWLLYLIRGVEEVATWTTERIAAIQSLAAQTAEYVRVARPKTYSRELIDAIFTQPYCRIGNLVDADIGGRQAASRYLKALIELGVLHQAKVGREKLFVNTRLMALLTKDGDQIAPFPAITST